MPMPASITLRPILPDDEAFLYQVYASTREDELAVVDWDETQKTAFLRMQFAAQHHCYQSVFADADYSVIQKDGRPIGRYYVHRRSDEIRIIDIALLPEQRGAGIGGAIMRDLLAEAAWAGKPVRIHVEHNNPALRLYRRLGFESVGTTDFYYLMERLPTAPAT